MLVEFIFLIFYVLQTKTLDLLGSDYNPQHFTNCYDNLGCIETTDEWYDQDYRPVNFEPLEKHIIRTEFILIKLAPNGTDLLYDLINVKKESIQMAGYRTGGSIVFLIHDFTSNGYTGWIKHLALVVLSRREICNVVSVDWESGAEPPYDQAIANARVVALEAIALIRSLKKEFNLAEERIHLIGHGVGAHIAGYIGKNFTNLGRITDPNGPRFDHMPPRVRLYRNDALFVEVLHTDAYTSTSQGTKEQLGHADFYFNNAEFQPNCIELPTRALTDIDRDFIKAGNILPGCSHKRAFKYFIESIDNSECKFLGVHCHSYKDFIQGQCHDCECKNGNSSCAEINLKESRRNLNGTYYVNTRGDPPYCMQAYMVTFKVDGNGKTKEGKFEMIMVGENNEVANVSTIDTRLRKIVPGRTINYLFYSSPPQLLDIKEVKLKWEHVNNIDCFAFCDEAMYIDEVKITPLTLRKQSSFTSTLCPVKGKIGIQSGNYLTFSKCGENIMYLIGKNVPTFDYITPVGFHVPNTTEKMQVATEKTQIGTEKLPITTEKLQKSTAH